MIGRGFRLSPIPAALVLAVAAEGRSNKPRDFGIVVADGAVGAVLVVQVLPAAEDRTLLSLELAFSEHPLRTERGEALEP